MRVAQTSVNVWRAFDSPWVKTGAPFACPLSELLPHIHLFALHLEEIHAHDKHDQYFGQADLPV